MHTASLPSLFQDDTRCLPIDGARWWLDAGGMADGYRVAGWECLHERLVQLDVELAPPCQRVPLLSRHMLQLILVHHTKVGVAGDRRNSKHAIVFRLPRMVSGAITRVSAPDAE